MDSLFLLLQRIRETPGLYLGKKSLKLLVQFNYGYGFREFVNSWEKSANRDFFENFDEAMMSKTPALSGLGFMDGFNEFVYSYYNCENNALTGEYMISMNSSSEEEAFDTFFELLDAFMKEKGRA